MGAVPRPGPSSSSGCPGQRYQAEINDLENLGEMGSGTCGQVWKMRFRKTGHVIAVKVSPAPREPRPESQPPLLPTCVLRLPWSSVQQMRRSGNKEENKRILMDLDVVLKSHDCPYIVQCFGTFITNVSAGRQPRTPVPGALLLSSFLGEVHVGWAGVGGCSRAQASLCCARRRTSSSPWSSWARAPRSSRSGCRVPSPSGSWAR